MTTMSTLQSSKKSLRKAIALTLDALTNTQIEQQSQAVFNHVIHSPFFKNSNTISCYLSMPTGELQTSSIVSEILRAGKTLFVPKMDTSKDGKMDFLKVYGEEDLRSFPSGKWGIREPDYDWRGERRATALSSVDEQLDLILLPGVAFDGTLSRLGHGKGYYDRFITSYANVRGKRPLLVALSLQEQILDDGAVPMGDHDWKMDYIVGPGGILEQKA